jgi:hypothetical protein
MVRGTADPSAALGMTKGRATLPWSAVVGQKVFFITLGGPQAHDSFGLHPIAKPLEPLRQHLIHHAAVNICQPEGASLEFEGKLGVIESQKLQNRCVKIVHVNLVLRDVEA